jgi:hypothetical protein
MRGPQRPLHIDSRPVDIEDLAPGVDIFGPAPLGRLILASAHTMAAFLSRPDRKTALERRRGSAKKEGYRKRRASKSNPLTRDVAA